MSLGNPDIEQGPANGQIAAHVLFLNAMRPAKESSATRERVNVARWAKVAFKIYIFRLFNTVWLIISFKVPI